MDKKNLIIKLFKSLRGEKDLLFILSSGSPVLAIEGQKKNKNKNINIIMFSSHAINSCPYPWFNWLSF
jgi:hypothetical protein